MSGQATPNRAARRASRRGAGRRSQFAEAPVTWRGTTAFADHDKLVDPVQLIALLRGHDERFPSDQILAPLIAKTTVSAGWGRPRLPGSWVVMYLAYILTGRVDMDRFWQDHQSSALWALAGFEALPCADTLRRRFIELELFITDVRDAADALIARARAADGRVGRWRSIDGRAYQTNAALEHCCPDPRACRALSRSQGRRRPPGRWAPKASGTEITELRKRDLPASETDPSQPPDSVTAIEHGDEDDRYRYYKINAHLFRSRDKDAGIRYYAGARPGRGKFWHGGNDVSATCLFTGGRLSDHCVSASALEASPEVYDVASDRATAAVGEPAVAEAADRGFSFPRIFERNLRAGTAPVIPFRKTRAGDRDVLRTDRYDEHGVPRCQHCGGEGDFTSAGLGLKTQRGEPRLHFRCMIGNTAACARVQSIACSQQWRLLNPLDRRADVYHAISRASRQRESTDHHVDRRGRVAGKDFATRPKRIGQPVQQLRSETSRFLEWLRICLIRGWLPGYTRPSPIPGDELAPVPLSAGDRTERVWASRRRKGLSLPYGPAAERLKLAAGGGGPPDDPDDPDFRPF
jgi:hypothetical protein